MFTGLLFLLFCFLFFFPTCAVSHCPSLYLVFYLWNECGVLIQRSKCVYLCYIALVWSHTFHLQRSVSLWNILFLIPVVLSVWRERGSCTIRKIFQDQKTTEKQNKCMEILYSSSSYLIFPFLYFCLSFCLCVILFPFFCPSCHFFLSSLNIKTGIF